MGSVITAYFANNNLVIILGGGITAILAQKVVPYLWDKLLASYENVKIKELFANLKYKQMMLVVSILVALFGTFYITYPEHTKGQILYATENILLKEAPGVGGIVIKTINGGEKVVYISKMWRRIRWYENGKYFDFWTKVKTKQNQIGWVYGAYLSENK